MGNCQAIDAATLVIQHPCGKAEKLYWPVCAGEIMKMNPGHYVALLISTAVCPPPQPPHKNAALAKEKCSAAAAPAAAADNNSVRVTRIKLLRPTDTLALGQVYRLITAKEVMKVLSAKKHAKMRKGQHDIKVEHEEKLSSSGLEIIAPRRSDSSDPRKENQVARHERHRQKTSTASSNSAVNRPRTWQPKLQSISEAAS
ncbi:uncharacterized protein LOC115741529 [Rhodamnia argentea]|uniref:Uncharacterized protein LOC115741529 n=1 Tax=Rhodamnia argentea TaxID=178133 RepID=A0A8B8P9I9_9MYRT|nr:uncharacterized protein LOC115741529 [Rhodamnia argentea]